MADCGPVKASISVVFKIARLVEVIVAPLGGHVALTGGCLYKDGPRKDLDLVIYRHGTDPVLVDAVVESLRKIHWWSRASCNRRVVKMKTADGVIVDLFFVEEYPALSGEKVSGGEGKELV